MVYYGIEQHQCVFLNTAEDMGTEGIKMYDCVTTIHIDAIRVLCLKRTIQLITYKRKA